MSFTDPEYRREYMREWRLKHLEGERQRGRDYYAKNASAVCERTNAHERLPEVKARRYELRQQKLADRRALLDAYKTERGCAVCGERHPACLDFHHDEPLRKRRHGKPSTISDIMRKASLPRLMGEVARCVVLCSNCHRKLHAEMGWEWTHRVSRTSASMADDGGQLSLIQGDR